MSTTKTPLPSLRKGNIIRIEFLDHVQGGCSTMRFMVYGRVHSVQESAVVLDSWHLARRRPKRFNVDNETRYVIVRSAILGITKLVPEA